MKNILCCFFILIFSIFANAEINLIVWQSDANSVKIILPQLDNENPKQAVERYLKNISGDPELSKISSGIEKKSMGQIQSLSVENNSGKVRLAFIANWLQDMLANGQRIERLQV